MISKLTSNLNKLFRLSKRFSTIQKATSAGTPAKRERLQFSKAKLTDYGELPQGEIPEALQYSPPHQLTQLNNGIRVASESWNSPVAALNVTIKVGTRQETLETSGASQFLEKLHLRGTQTRSREQIESQLNQLGGHLDIKTTRELTTYTLSFEKDKLNQAAELLGDILQNSLYNKNQIEAERDAILNLQLTNQSDQMNTTFENVHYTAYRDHFMGQPVLGIRENAHQITAEQIKEFRDTNYIAPNFVVVGTGNIDHARLVDAVEKNFGKLPTSAPEGLRREVNKDKPYFTPSTLMIRDDEMANVNVGVFFEAPTWTDKDFFAMQVFKNIMGSYSSDKYTGHHLNTADRQYSLIHTELGNLPDVNIHKCEYFPYSDTALFGNYFFGNEVFANQMLYMSQMILSEYASTLNVVEFFRARNKIFNDLLEEKNSCDVAREIGEQITYLGRRVQRSEFAKRVSSLDTGILNRVATRWFWDKELAVVAWGPIHGLMSFSHYNRPLKRSTLGWYGSQHYRIV